MLQEYWKHIASEHPQVASLLEEIQETIRNPLLVTKSSTDPSVHYYYRYNKKIALYLVVLIKFLNDIGIVISSYYTAKIFGLR